ncbi:hypothetical protein HR060_12705 [Catenovulum sp. SM1970]|uniref:DUF6942 family protein n=1 Tax=Marinifaba aquimaris TaxID=2741323 RepID=UPI0015727322|nr:hypothetical protein [Marinifaba aquimaris]NTS77721.1 hypothetical protein [Marinifaba aquimaris]
MIGLGVTNAKIEVYIANRPPLMPYGALDDCHLLEDGEIKFIADKTGNHWRKVFNVFAKFRYALKNDWFDDQTKHFNTWQNYRDERLLQINSDTNLRFDAIDALSTQSNTIRLIAGKQYAEQLLISADLSVIWLNESFAINPQQRIIVCPYFDYRQLSNIKIAFLIELINQYFTEQ